MTLWGIAWGYLWNRKFTAILTILSVALAVALISSVLTLREETRKRFEEEGQAFDLVVGAKGSPLQLVLSSVYFMDNPTGNIPWEVYEQIKNDKEYVQIAYPIALGDNYQGFRIVGTEKGLFQHKWISPITGEERQPFQVAKGRIFEQSFEAVLGALVAKETGLDIGDSFISSHGFVNLPEVLGGHGHEQHPYVVVGILKPSNSPFDRAIFTSIDSVWDIHANHEEEKEIQSGKSPEEEGDIRYQEWGKNPRSMITAVLVQLQSPALRFQYREMIRESTVAMAATPVEEISKLFEQFLGTAKTVLLTIGYLVVVVSALSIMIGLYLAIIQRRRDLAIMRALGASRVEIFGSVLIEAFWITLLGIFVGYVLGGIVSKIVGLYLTQKYGLSVTPFILTPEHITSFATVAVMGLLAGIIPAWQAYRRNIARDLMEL
ncbi:MAG: ABC transporter permease [Candidatus Hydrogenedentes bacterium]|nr:ABC transporter permease [Candidatus Hydrogenedentota bacterium]